MNEKAATFNRLLSPPFPLRSNDDELERARARAARAAAALRRRNISTTPPPPPDDPFLSSEQIVDLFQNCIKLASENKINQKNTWELKLIDHLSEIVKVETVEGQGHTETNFQKASCTLEAGVKIYAVRVDAVHAEAYKLLGGINRVGQEHEEVTNTTADRVDNGEDGARSKKHSEKKISPLSTLESSFESLNLKKFDVAFAVDPLYHQTSAQFDEGGAKGLLLNNLGVYGGCRVLFDSCEVPGKCTSDSLQNNNSDLIDLSFAKELIEQMVVNMLEKTEISPTLKEIICHFDEENQRSSQTFDPGQKFDAGVDELDASAEALDIDEVGLNDNSFGNHESWGFDHDGGAHVASESSTFDPTYHGNHEENDLYTAYEPDVDGGYEDVTTLLFQGLGFTAKQNAWAGPDHWKYRKFKGSEDVSTAESGSTFNTKRKKEKSQAEVDINFMKSLDREMLDIFAPPKNPKSLLLPVNRAPCSQTLPEDCHYQPESLVKLFLLPNVLCMGKGRKKLSGNNWRQQNDDYDGGLPSWDNESVLSGQYDDGCVPNDVGDLDELVPQPRQVDKIEVQYDKTSKQVDVHVLKETLWDLLQESTPVLRTNVCEDRISFRHVLATFPVDCRAAAPKDISPHLCFICLLHLANEHGLIIRDFSSLDDLGIYLPSAHQNTDRDRVVPDSPIHHS